MNIEYIQYTEGWRNYFNHVLSKGGPHVAEDGEFITQEVFDTIKSLDFYGKRGIFINTKVFPDIGVDFLEQLIKLKMPENTYNLVFINCLKYALETENCHSFWNKYKNTIVAQNIMASILGGKFDSENLGTQANST